MPDLPLAAPADRAGPAPTPLNALFRRIGTAHAAAPAAVVPVDAVPSAVRATDSLASASAGEPAAASPSSTGPRAKPRGAKKAPSSGRPRKRVTAFERRPHPIPKSLQIAQLEPAAPAVTSEAAVPLGPTPGDQTASAAPEQVPPADGAPAEAVPRTLGFEERAKSRVEEVIKAPVAPGAEANGVIIVEPRAEAADGSAGVEAAETPAVIEPLPEVPTGSDGVTDIEVPEVILPVPVDIEAALAGKAAKPVDAEPGRDAGTSVSDSPSNAAPQPTAGDAAEPVAEPVAENRSHDAEEPAIVGAAGAPAAAVKLRAKSNSLAEHLRRSVRRLQSDADEPAVGSASALAANPAPSLLRPAAKRPSRTDPTLVTRPRDPVTLPAERTGGNAVAEFGRRNRRLYRRVALQAEMEIDHAPCRLIDLSLGGFAAAGARPVSIEGIVPVTLRMTIDGIELSTKMGARIVYTQDARIGGRFVELTASQTAFLRHIVTSRGEAIGASGTTTLLEAITRRPERALTGEVAPRKPGLIARWVDRLFGRRREE